jgi:hypothetical protein
VDGSELAAERLSHASPLGFEDGRVFALAGRLLPDIGLRREVDAGRASRCSARRRRPSRRASSARAITGSLACLTWVQFSSVRVFFWRNSFQRAISAPIGSFVSPVRPPAAAAAARETARSAALGRRKKLRVRPIVLSSSYASHPQRFELVELVESSAGTKTGSTRTNAMSCGSIRTITSRWG